MNPVDDIPPPAGKTAARARTFVLLAVAAALAACLSACGPSGPAGPRFQRVAVWPAPEWQKLAGLPDLFRPGTNQIFRADWVQDGVTNRVFLERVGFQTTKEPYRVFVFDAAGALAELNEIEIYAGFEPRVLVGMGPVRVAFGVPGRRRAELVARPTYAGAEWQQRMRAFRDIALRQITNATPSPPEETKKAPARTGTTP